MSDCTRLEQQSVDYLEGDLDPEARAELELHLAGCTACQDTLRSYRAIRGAYRTGPEEDASPAVAQAILAAARPGRRLSRPLLLVAAALALLVALPVAFFAVRGDDYAITVLIRRGDAQRDAGELEGAESTYREALALAGKGERGAEISHRLAALHVAEREFERALGQLDSLIEAHPEYEGRQALLLLRGEALAGLGRPAQAIEAYQRVAAEFPGARDETARRVRELVNGLSAEESESLQALGYMGD